MPELSLLTEVLDDAVRSGEVPGSLAVLRVDGTVVHSSAHGVADAESGHVLRPDTGLWLASLSKPIGAAALLSLVDEGRGDLQAPVSRYVPEFAGPGRVRVLRHGSPSPVSAPFGPAPDPAPLYDETAVERELTVFDLITHTGGLQSIFLWNPEYLPPTPGQTLADHVPGLGHLVRDFQAGSAWAYSNGASFDVLSRIIEIVTGQELDAVLHERLLDPLGMTATGFGRGGDGDVAPVPAMFAANPVIQGTTMQTCSAGLWSTAEDYLRFAEMLRGGGTVGGRRLLSAAVVEQMTTNQVGDLCPGLNGREPAPGVGFGLGVAVLVDPAAAGEALPARTWGWDGVGTRRFWVSPSDGWSLFCYVPSPVTQRRLEAAVVAALR